MVPRARYEHPRLESRLVVNWGPSAEASGSVVTAETGAVRPCRRGRLSKKRMLASRPPDAPHVTIEG
jgi:hypothetical protein